MLDTKIDYKDPLQDTTNYRQLEALAESSTPVTNDSNWYKNVVNKAWALNSGVITQMCEDLSKDTKFDIGYISRFTYLSSNSEDLLTISKLDFIL